MSYPTKFRVFPRIKENEISLGYFHSKGQEKAPQKGIFAISQNLKKNQLNGAEFGFVKSIVFAYNNHHSVVIRPDDSWIAILSQFSLYINGNAEKYRNKFVNFDGKKDLKIYIGFGESMKNVPWITEKFTELIHENVVDPELRDWILPDFSTTTENDKIVCGIQMMSIAKHYFNYKMYRICGIPFVTLEGTLDDWKNILEKIEKLREYDLDKWVDMLKPILGEFVNAKNGQVDKEFWKKICQYKNKGFCGDGGKSISGWITAFSPFDYEGKWNYYDVKMKKTKSKLPWPEISYSSIPSGRSSANVIFEDGTKSYKTEFVSGHFGFDVLPDKNTLQAKAGWYTALVEDNKRKYGEMNDYQAKKRRGPR